MISINQIFWGIGKYRIAGYENRYRILTNHLIYTPNANAYLDSRKHWSAPSHCSVLTVKRFGRLVLQRDSPSAASWWKTSRCHQTARPAHSGPAQSSRPDRADPRSPAGRPETHSEPQPLDESVCQERRLETLHLHKHTIRTAGCTTLSVNMYGEFIINVTKQHHASNSIIKNPLHLFILHLKAS